MKRFIISTTIPLVLVALAIYWIISLWGPEYQWRQKLIVTVETSEGLKTGSSVTEVAVHQNRFFKDGAEWQTKLTGEATVVEMAPGRYLFALLGEASTKELATRVWRVTLSEEQRRDPRNVYQIIENSREAREVQSKEYPLLVTFMDVNDPKSVRLVDPANLAASIGIGYNLKSIMLEITDDPVTEGKVERVLGWAPNLIGSIGKGLKLPYDHLLNQINDGSFIQGSN